jgi:hypothetical protein
MVVMEEIKMKRWATIVMGPSMLMFFLAWEIFGAPTWAASPQTTDDFLMEVASRYPGFGGLFIGSDGALYVYMLEDAMLEDTPAAAASAVATN